jgi:hypothetical protein
MKVMVMELHFTILPYPKKNILSLVEDPTLAAGRGKDILTGSF